MILTGAPASGPRILDAGNPKAAVGSMSAFRTLGLVKPAVLPTGKSPGDSRGLGQLLSAALLLLIGASGCRTAAQRDPPPGPTAPPRIVTAGWPRAVPSFGASAEAVLGDLERWRGLEFKGALEVEFVPQPRSGGEAACWYDPGARRLMVVKGASGDLDREVLVREFTHALQDQRFGLAPLRGRARDEDEARAIAALIEGEAMLAVSDLLPHEVGRQSTLPLRGPITPECFQQAFNEDAGMRFVQALREAGGWELVDRAFRNPPQRTAEVLSPSLYVERTRVRDEEELFTAWRLTPFQAGEYQPLGAYEVHFLLAVSEATRLRARELAATVRAAKSAHGEETTWILLLSSPQAAQEMLEAAWLAGATNVEASSPDQRLVCFRPPRGFLASHP